LNAAAELLDRMVKKGHRDRPCLRTEKAVWTYGDLLEKANRIANVLVRDLGIKPGNRVLLRAANTPMLVASWFAVLKAGGISVATMPLLRAQELNQIIRKADIKFVICDNYLKSDLEDACEQDERSIATIYFNSDAADGLESRMRQQPSTFENATTSH